MGPSDNVGDDFCGPTHYHSNLMYMSLADIKEDYLNGPIC